MKMGYYLNLWTNYGDVIMIEHGLYENKSAINAPEYFFFC
jgi:hypothetical protein